VMMLWGTVRSLHLLLQNFALGREILASLLFAAGASVLAGFAVFWLDLTPDRGCVADQPQQRENATRPSNTPAVVAAQSSSGSRPQGLGRWLLFTAAFAGLLGPLVLSLAVLGALQWPGLLSLRDTPAPLVLCLVLLPLALVLKRVLQLTGHQSAFHLTRLMPRSAATRDLTWRLGTSGKFWLIAILFVWAFWDLTCSAILAPIGMTPVTVRLYNLMHYGQMPALSAMTCAAFLAPIAILLSALTTRRWWAPR
jgi:ABC-type Fe3+ transport system permease subunit